jgi:hypothetical protein
MNRFKVQVVGGISRPTRWAESLAAAVATREQLMREYRCGPSLVHVYERRGRYGWFLLPEARMEAKGLGRGD